MTRAHQPRRAASVERERRVWRRGFHLPEDPNKTQGCLWLLAELSRDGGCRVAFAMDSLGIELRTLRRYVATLRGMGLIVLDDDTGDARTLRLHRARFTVEGR